MRTGDEASAPLALVGKLILGAVARLVGLVVITVLGGGEEVAEPTLPDPVEVSP